MNSRSPSPDDTTKRQRTVDDTTISNMDISEHTIIIVIITMVFIYAYASGKLKVLR